MRTLKDWVDKSYKLPGIKENFFLTVDFQALGRLDIELLDIWKSRLDLINEPKTQQGNTFNIQEAIKQQRVFEYSRLWVLAGYEIVRQLKNSDNSKFREIYDSFREVRIPLAKYEKAGDNGGRINIARPGIVIATGDIGWEVGERKFITREELADRLLKSI